MDKNHDNLYSGSGGGGGGSGIGIGDISSDDIHESEDAGNDEYTTDNDNNFESNLRKRKGKIISCAKETIENASRQLRRKVPYAGHLMTPRRLWLNKIPTQCDVVIEFPEESPDEALRWLLSRIRSQPPSGLGLIAHVKSHESTKRTAFYISASINTLYKAAEEARLPKRLRNDLGGALREFTTRENHCFSQFKSDDGSTTLFTSQERQWLVLQMLQGIRAGPSDLDALQGKARVEEGQSIVAAWQESGLILQVFPLHEPSALTQLQLSWVRKIFAPQPLDDIAEYFGVKVALYFAWLGHYTCALGVPAVFGTMLWAALWGRGETAQDMGHVLFSLFNVAWASLYLEAWRRYSVELAFRWGTLSTPPELLEPPRPLYKGPLVESCVTGRLEPKDASIWQQRAFRYFVSFPIIGLCLLLVFLVMFLMLQFQDWLDHHLPETGFLYCMCNANQDWWDSKLPEGSIISCLSVIPKVLLAGAITLMDEAYYKLAVWLNDKENYRLQSKYENHLIAKVALFQFVNSFLSLFYIAFYLRDQDKLKEQLAGLLISRQIIGNLRESAIPYMIEQWKLAKLSFKLGGAFSPTQDQTKSILDTQINNSTESVDKPNNLGTTTATTTATTSPTEILEQASNKRNIGQAEIESSLYKYDGTFSDHLEMLVQMGYVVLFSAAFPLAGLCALANNLLEIRSDAFKLAHVHQRPFGQRVANIGTWQNALSILSLAAVIVNCALIGLSGQVSRLWPGLTTTQTIILIVTLEHIMLALRSALTWLLPELPSWLAAEIARAEHCRREMQVKGTSPRQTPPSPPSTTSMSQQMTPGDLATTNDESMESQLAEDYIFHAHNPTYMQKLDDIHAQLQQKSLEKTISMNANRDSSPDSPPSQTSTILIRPLHESTPPNSGVSMQYLPYDNHPISGACKSCKEKMSIPVIPPFRGQSIRNLSQNAQMHAFSGSSTSSMAISKPMQIPEIPPFRKKSDVQEFRRNDSRDSTDNESPQKNINIPKIAEIPSFKPRKSTEWTPQTNNESKDTKLMKPPSHVPEWMSRLKVNETTNIHRSIDCIASKELANNTETEYLKPAPSWSNVATTKPTPPQSTTSTLSAVMNSNATAVVSSSSSSNHSGRSGSITTATSAEPSSSGSHKTTTTQNVDDDVKAAELAAKKSGLKQTFVKRARSVAIFSLKLKERRQKEAEKAATAALEQAKSTKPTQYGGELSLIPIEQLIQIDDVIKQSPKSPPGSGSSEAF